MSVNTLEGKEGDTQPLAEPLLRVRDLRVEFRMDDLTVVAVDGISYDVFHGETVGIVGESGSGKSVGARAVMGIIQSPPGYVTDGSIQVAGEELVGAHPRTIRQIQGERIAMIFQEPHQALNPVQSVGKQLVELLCVRRGFSKRIARKHARDLLTRVHIPDASRRLDDYPHQFSGGMAQRVMIAAALALEPEILIADEPTTALDVTVQAQIMRLLEEIQLERDMGVVLITHDLAVVAEKVDRLAIMYAGRFVEVGPVGEVFAAPAHPYTRALMNSIPRPDVDVPELHPIRGAPPDPRSPMAGCPFRPRCDWAVDACYEAPPLVSLNANRLAACHRQEEVHSEARGS